LRENHVVQVRGYADQMPRKPDDPLDPSNRRISVIVQYVEKNSRETNATTAPTTKSE